MKDLDDGKQKTMGILIFWGMAFFIFFYIITSVRFFSTGDAKHFLYVTQAIIDQGTIKLDGQPVDPRHYGITLYNGHLYNFYPVFPSLIAIPIVYTAKLLGCTVTTHNDFLQNIISALLCVLTFTMLVCIAKQYLKKYESLYIAFLFFLGTSLTSTNGAAYFSSTSASFFSFAAILYFVKSIHDEKNGIYLFLLAFFSYLSFLCRQQLCIFVFFILCSYYFVDKRSLIKIIIYLSLFQIVYSIFLFKEYGEFFIPIADMHYKGIYFFNSLIALLISPNRGLFIFSPLLLIPYVLLPFCKHLKKEIIVITIIYPIAYLCFIAAYASWHGGWSFGPRYLLDILPALFLLLCLVWSRFRSRKLLIAYTLLGLASVFIHHEGLHCLKTAQWSEFYGPHGDANHDPGMFFNWKNMQMFARFHKFPSEEKKKADSTIIRVSGISPIKTHGVWWSDADINRNVIVHFSPPLRGSFVLNLQMKANHPQQVTVTAGRRTLSFRTKGPDSIHYPLALEAETPVENIVLTPSNPHRPKRFGSPSDSRKQGIGIEKIWLSPR